MRMTFANGLVFGSNFWVMSVLSLLIGVTPSSAQLIISSTSGPLAANIDFRGTVSYDLSAVGGAGNSGTFSGYDLTVSQTATSTGFINFNYPPAGPYDFTTATGFGTGGFRTTFRYMNNTGASIPGLRFDLTQGQSAFFTNLNGVPSRGNLTNPTGPSPSFTGLTSNQVPNGDALIHNGNAFQVDTTYDWSFASPLSIGGTYAFFLPIEGPVTSPGGLPPGAFTLAITPIPEPSALVLVGAGAVCGWARRRGVLTLR